MKKTLVLAVALALNSGNVLANHLINGNLEKCTSAALKKHAGDILSLEVEKSGKKTVYEFDIVGKDGKEYEVECAAATGKIIEEELEVADANDAAFKEKAKVSFEDAKKTALAQYNGEVTETEFKIEADGTPSYEFDIKTADGKEYEVEVDAVSGKVLASQEELLQIGKD